MGDLRQFRVALEETWRDRLEQASHCYRSAQLEAAKASGEARSGDIPHPDGQFAASRALQVASTALAEYRRVLNIFNELVLNGKIPGPDA